MVAMVSGRDLLWLLACGLYAMFAVLVSVAVWWVLAVRIEQSRRPVLEPDARAHYTGRPTGFVSVGFVSTGLEVVGERFADPATWDPVAFTILARRPAAPPYDWSRFPDL